LTSSREYRGRGAGGIEGAAGVLAKWKTRLMMDSYHLPDGDVVLPAAISAANQACSPDRFSNGRLIPDAAFHE